MTTPNARTSAVLPLIEVGAVAALAFGLKALLGLVLWRYAGPISLALLLAALTVYLRTRGLGWANFGLRTDFNLKAWLWLPLQALLAFVVILGTGVATAQLGSAAGFAFMGETPAGIEDRWGAVIDGSWPHYLLWLAIAVLAAGFGEEMFFRGYLINRLRDGLGRTGLATLMTILLPALFFGMGHVYYQGLRGFITTGMIGIMLGLLFLAYKRNLWPLIIAHAAVDSLVFTALFFGLDV